MIQPNPWMAAKQAQPIYPQLIYPQPIYLQPPAQPQQLTQNKCKVFIGNLDPVYKGIILSVSKKNTFAINSKNAATLLPLRSIRIKLPVTHRYISVDKSKVTAVITY
jgi:hypothetical protein